MSLIHRLSRVPGSARVGALIACGLTIFPLGAFLAYVGLAVGNALAEWGQSSGIGGLGFLAPVVGLTIYVALIVAIPALVGGVLGWSVHRMTSSFGRAS